MKFSKLVSLFKFYFMKYKVGDILKPRKGHEEYCINYLKFSGDYIRITGVSRRDYYCYDIYRNNVQVCACSSCFNDDNLEPITPEIKNSKPPMQFKIGDVVRIKSDSKYEEQNDRIGNGEIKSIEKGGAHDYKITFSNRYRNSYNSKDLELISPEITNSKPPMQKRYILLKDAPNVKKGAIYEEMYGNLFKLITPEHDKFPDDDGAGSAYRESIINNPEWYEEVVPACFTKEQREEIIKIIKTTI